MQLTRDDRTRHTKPAAVEATSQGWGNRAVAARPSEILPCLEEQD